jgi:hypothetical protein
MKEFPKCPFKAVCIKEFNTKRVPGQRWLAWGCLELLKVYEFENAHSGTNRLHTSVKNVSENSGFIVGKIQDKFNISTTKEAATISVPYFWDHFIIL